MNTSRISRRVETSNCLASYRLEEATTRISRRVETELLGKMLREASLRAARISRRVETHMINKNPVIVREFQLESQEGLKPIDVEATCADRKRPRP